MSNLIQDLSKTDGITNDHIVAADAKSSVLHILGNVYRTLRDCRGTYDDLLKELGVTTDEKRIISGFESGLADVKSRTDAHGTLYSDSQRISLGERQMAAAGITQGIYVYESDMRRVILHPEVLNWIHTQTEERQKGEWNIDRFVPSCEIQFALKRDLSCAHLACRNKCADALRPRITSQMKMEILAAANDRTVGVEELSAMVTLYAERHNGAPLHSKDCSEALEMLDPSDRESLQLFLTYFADFAYVEDDGAPEAAS